MIHIASNNLPPVAPDIVRRMTNIRLYWDAKYTEKMRLEAEVAWTPI
jgi:hypothetical protein